MSTSESGLTKKVLEKPKEGGCALRADESRDKIALTPSHLWQTRDPSTPGPTTRRSREQLPLAEAATIRRARAPAEQRADHRRRRRLTDEEEESAGPRAERRSPRPKHFDTWSGESAARHLVPEACLASARSLGKVSHRLPNKFLGLFSRRTLMMR